MEKRGLTVLRRYKNKILVEKSANLISPNLEKKELPHIAKTPLWYIILENIHSDEYTNLKVVIGSTSFKCHTFVLVAFSKYFRDKTREDIVELDEQLITPEVFHLVYKWMKSCGKAIENKFILEMLRAAEYLDIPLLKDKCTLRIKSEKDFDEGKAHNLVHDAQLAEMKQALLMLLTRIKKYFLAFVASPEFLNLKSNELAYLLSFDDIWVTCELQVLMSVFRWLIHDLDTRMKDIKEVLQNVRFELFSKTQVLLLRITKMSEITKIILDNDFDEIMTRRTNILFASKKHSLENNMLTNLNKLSTKNTVKSRIWMDDYAWDVIACKPPAEFFTYVKFDKYLLYLSMTKDHWKEFQKRLT